MQQTPESDPLDKLLRQWDVQESLPPGFSKGVWQRIGKAEEVISLGLGQALFRWLRDVLPRPGFALSYFSILLALGIAAGTLAAHNRLSRIDSELSARYVQSLDPFRSDSNAP